MKARDINKLNNMYKVGELSKKVDVSARMLRHFEELHLIEPARTLKEYRCYSEADYERVIRIKFFQQLGFSLKLDHSMKFEISQF